MAVRTTQLDNGQGAVRKLYAVTHFNYHCGFRREKMNTKNGEPGYISPSMILDPNQNLCLQRSLFRSLSSAHRLSHPAVTGWTVHLLCPGLPRTHAALQQPRQSAMSTWFFEQMVLLLLIHFLTHLLIYVFEAGDVSWVIWDRVWRVGMPWLLDTTLWVGHLFSDYTGMLLLPTLKALPEGPLKPLCFLPLHRCCFCLSF